MINKKIKDLARKLNIDIRKYDVSDYGMLMQSLSYYGVDLILDVGANQGQYAKFIRNLGYSQKIISFEPLQTPYSELIASSKSDPLWTVADRMAIGNLDGEISINVSRNSYSSSILPILDDHLASCPESEYISTEVVEIKKIDTIIGDYLGAENKLFLKIDVQGYEVEVLEGAANAMKSFCGVQLEMSVYPLYSGESSMKEVIDFMESKEYFLHRLIPGFSDQTSGKMLQVDGIFFRQGAL